MRKCRPRTCIRRFTMLGAMARRVIGNLYETATFIPTFRFRRWLVEPWAILTAVRAAIGAKSEVRQF